MLGSEFNLHLYFSGFFLSYILLGYSGTMVDMIEAEAAPVDMRANYVEETGKVSFWVHRLPLLN